IEVHFPGIKGRLVAEALRLFYEIRDVPGLKKKPSTSELLDWLKLLMVEDIGPETLRERDPKKLVPPLAGALSKNEHDVHLFARLAFRARGEGRCPVAWVEPQAKPRAALSDSTHPPGFHFVQSGLRTEHFSRYTAQLDERREIRSRRPAAGDAGPAVAHAV